MGKTATLKIAIKTGDPRPIFKQIVDGIGMAIATGEITEGDKLPSVRALAMRLAINPNTVAKAYNELTNLGLVDARQGLGLFVSVPKQMLSNPERRKRLQQAIERFLGDVMPLNYSDEEILRAFRIELEGLRKVPKAG